MSFNKKDYEEPRCPMDNSMWVKKQVTPIPIGRVIAKEDEFLGKNDYNAAERHLLYWWEEAERGNDDRGLLLLCNELMGLHRKLGHGEEAKKYAEKSLQIVKNLNLSETIAGATAYLNSGTVYKAFGEPEKSLEYFSVAKEVFETNEEVSPGRKAGFYNNMALTLVDLKRFDEAEELYRKAILLVKDTDKADEAISWLNLADCCTGKKGMEEAESETGEYLDNAERLLNEVPPEERDSYYAYVCEKCAPVFDYYGYFFFADELRERATTIYEKNQKQED